jgi:hypothetical protein
MEDNVIGVELYIYINRNITLVKELNVGF